MYESRLSDKRWWILGVLSDLGWIALIAGIILYMISGADGLGTVIISITFILTFLSAVFVLIGVIVLIAQRLRKIDRVLTKKQLACGFGFVVYGSLAAGVFALASVMADSLWHCEAGVFLIAQCLICAGGWLCFAFGLPIFKSFRKQS